MSQPLRSRRSYDHRIREIVCQMPHHAFSGQTPDEVYFDQADGVRERLIAARRQARLERMEASGDVSLADIGVRSSIDLDADVFAE